MSTGTRLVLIDTNAFLRLYCCPLSPLLQQQVGGLVLLTLETLIKEFLDNPDLTNRYQWVAKDPNLENLKSAALKVSGIKKKQIEEEKKALRRHADELLRAHCSKQKINLRQLSSRDLELLATAAVFDAVLITDEWPLQFVAEDLKGDADYKIDTGTSIDILSLLETNGLITRDKRIQTCDSWIRLQEKLPRDWKTRYQQLFNEVPPTGV